MAVPLKIAGGFLSWKIFRFFMDLVGGCYALVLWKNRSSSVGVMNGYDIPNMMGKIWKNKVMFQNTNQWMIWGYPLVNKHIAIENGPVEIVGLPIFIAWWCSHQFFVNVYQAGYQVLVKSEIPSCYLNGIDGPNRNRWFSQRTKPPVVSWWKSRWKTSRGPRLAFFRPVRVWPTAPVSSKWSDQIATIWPRKCWISTVGGAPGRARVQLVYNSNNYGLWHL